LQLLDPALSHYRDRRFPGGQEQFEQRLTESTTLYIGNLSFYTTEEQVYEVRVTEYVQNISRSREVMFCIASHELSNMLHLKSASPVRANQEGGNEVW
jgi:hypothetical protein